MMSLNGSPWQMPQARPQPAMQPQVNVANTGQGIGQAVRGLAQDPNRTGGIGSAVSAMNPQQPQIMRDSFQAQPAIGGSDPNQGHAYAYGQQPGFTPGSQGQGHAYAYGQQPDFTGGRPGGLLGPAMRPPMPSFQNSLLGAQPQQFQPQYAQPPAPGQPMQAYGRSPLSGYYR
jgi:hypothetical protein